MTDIQIPKERDYQNRIIQRFQQELGYNYLGNLEYAKDKNVNNHNETNSPIIESELREFLQSQNKYTQRQIDEAISKLKSASNLGLANISKLIQTNNEVYDILISGIKAKPTPEKNEENVMFFDFENLHNNRFAIAEEVSYTDPITRTNRRPDIVVYVNGIALAVIELKRSLVSYEEGIKQHLTNEKTDIPSFFTTTQFTIASNDNADFRYGTIGTPLDFWCKWKKDTEQLGVKLSDKESYNLFFNKEQFLFFFRYGVINDGGVKKVLRPHQIYAIQAAAKRMPHKQSGVIWHSQGSGKSLTMVALANYIRNNFQNPRVVVITDRTELDLQLSNTFKNAGEKPHRAESCNDLLSALNSGSDWLICTLIHKFGQNTIPDQAETNKSGVKIPLDEYLKALEDEIAKKYGNNFKVKGDNIFIFIDECHRTQNGQLHEAMRKIMGQEVMLIGFTGTPLLKKDKDEGYKSIAKTSEKKFGPYIHKYLHKQAVEDKVILDLRYEYRDVEQVISDKEGLDEKYNELTAKYNEEQKQELDQRWATLRRVFSAKERIERICYSIQDDLNKSNGLLHQNWCNAMLVCDSIYSACRYYYFLNKDITELKGKCALVTSFDPNANIKTVIDPCKQTEIEKQKEITKQSYSDADPNGSINTPEQYEEWAKYQFTHYPAQMKLLIVVDKLLTGFDAPTATILYIDKEIKDHTLFQAICRVNRLGVDIKDKDGKLITKTQKEFGLIVDFRNLFGQIQDAITTFNCEKGTGFEGFDPNDVNGLLCSMVSKCKEKILAAEQAYNNLKIEWENKGLKTFNDIVDYYLANPDEDEDEVKQRREAMYYITSQMRTAYNNICDYFPQTDFSKEQISRFLSLANEAGKINIAVKHKSGDYLDITIIDPQMRELIDQYINSTKNAKTIICLSNDFSCLDLLNLIDVNTNASELADKIGSQNGSAELIEGMARSVVNNEKNTNPMAYKSFSQRLQGLLDMLKSRNATTKEKVNQLIQFIQEVKRGNTYPDHLTQKRRCLALWNNRTQWHAPQDDQQTIDLINQIDQFTDAEAPFNWKDPNNNDYYNFYDDLLDNFKLSEEETKTILDLLIKNS